MIAAEPIALVHAAPDPAGLNAAWGESVGPPVALDGQSDGNGSGSIALLCWNVWIGRGRLREMIGRIRAGDYAQQGFPAGTHVVALIQEAYRGGDDVPAHPRPRSAPRTVLRGGEEDVVGVARELALWLRFAPSMRNGRHRSDRGNAILATMPVAEAEAVVLPFSYQRRVALCAAVDLPGASGGSVRVRVCSAHLDPRGARALDVLGVAGRGRQIDALIRHLDRLPHSPQIVGADLNLARGTLEPAFRRLKAAGFAPGVPPTWPAWSHTYHRWPRLMLDWVLARDTEGRLAGIVVRRLDERPDDDGLLVFGSDHHPLLARVDLAPT